MDRSFRYKPVSPRPEEPRRSRQDPKPPEEVGFEYVLAQARFFGSDNAEKQIEALSIVNALASHTEDLRLIGVVHPKTDSILGETAYPTLEKVPEPVDVVDIFRPPHECLTYAEQAAAMGPTPSGYSSAS